MLTVMPDTVHKALGDALGDVAVRDFTVWLETAMTEHTVGPDAWSQAQVRFDNLETRLDRLETGQARLEAGQAKLEDRQAKLEDRQAKLEDGQAKLEIRMTNVETRLTMVEHDLAELKVDLRELRRDMTERFDRLQVQMLSQTRWIVGSFMLFGTLIAILVGIGQLRP